MSIGNLVQSKLTAPITAATTVITLDAPVAPFSLPPEDGGTLILADSLSRPTKIEIIKYSARSGKNLTGVTRAQEGTAAQAWVTASICYQSLTSEMFGGKVDAVAGKQLSSNDLTSELLTNLNALPDLALIHAITA